MRKRAIHRLMEGPSPYRNGWM